MKKDYNQLMKDWLEDIKERYSSDTVEDALAQGRVAIRTFHKDSLNTGYGKHYGIQDGEQGLKAMGQKLENPAKYSQSLSCSILPTRPFLATKDRLGILITLPHQEDIQYYKNLTNKDFIEYYKIDPKLVQEAKNYFTRVSYFHHDDLLAQKNKGHYRPNYDKFGLVNTEAELIVKGLRREDMKEKALHYQDYLGDDKMHNDQNYNEALVKVRPSSKFCVVAFNERDLKTAIEKDAKNLLPNNESGNYALFNPENNTVKFVDEKQYYKTGEIQFTHKINAFEATPKPIERKEVIPLERKLEASVKHISFKVKEEQSEGIHLPPINQKSKLRANNMKEEKNPPRHKNINHSQHKDDSKTHLPKINNKGSKSYGR